MQSLRVYSSGLAAARKFDVPIPYWLFSHTNRQGSFHSAAMLNVSNTYKIMDAAQIINYFGIGANKFLNCMIYE